MRRGFRGLTPSAQVKNWRAATCFDYNKAGPLLLRSAAMKDYPAGSGGSEIPSPITQSRTTPAQAAANSAAASPPIVIHAGSRWSSFWSRIGWTGFVFCGIALISMNIRLGEYFDNTGGITEKYHSGGKYVTDKIAILTVSGAIMDGDGFAKKQIDKILSDDSIKGVVLRIDSPGGSVSGSDYIYHHLKKLRAEKIKKLREKDSSVTDFPMIVSMGSMAASGGYYVAMAVEDQPKSIYAEPTTTTGSIGVMIPHYDLSELLEEKLKIKDDTIATHPRKLMLSMTKKMTPEEHELVRNYINESFVRFKDIIKDGRPHFKKDESALNELATGEIFTANQAKKLGLIDEIGFMEDAIDRVLELTGLEKDKVRIVKYESPTSLFDLDFARASKASHPALETLFEMSTPRAYYMCTTLPGMVDGR
jgi:protease-4